ncbi:MAG: hypothetical protein AAF944_04675 [Bacteroidota bacterium]
MTNKEKLKLLEEIEAIPNPTKQWLEKVVKDFFGYGTEDYDEESHREALENLQHFKYAK